MKRMDEPGERAYRRLYLGGLLKRWKSSRWRSARTTPVRKAMKRMKRPWMCGSKISIRQTRVCSTSSQTTHNIMNSVRSIAPSWGSLDDFA